MTESMPEFVPEPTPDEAGTDLVVVTGVSGGGRSTVARALENVGFYVVDNLPQALMLDMAQLAFEAGGAARRTAMVLDVRSRAFSTDLAGAVRALKDRGFSPRVVFVDADDEVLIRRFESVRRSHPLQGDGRLADGIAAERKLLEEAREQSDVIIDTSHLNVNQLRRRVEELFGGEDARRLRITVLSFGFKYGLPPDADYVMDARFLPNPFWVPELREHTGLEEGVSSYVLGQEGAHDFVGTYANLIAATAPGFERDAQLPPGDLRMALAALAGKDPGHQRTVALMQHRFALVGKPDRRSSDAATDIPVSDGPAGNAWARDAQAGDGPAGSSPANNGPVGNSPATSGSAGNSSANNGSAGNGPATDGPAGGSPANEGSAGNGQAGDGRARADDRRIASVGGRHDPLAGHAVGNLLLLGLLELLGDPVAALEHAGAMVGAQGRVLPMASHAVGIEADVRGGDPDRPDEIVTVRGQHAVAVTTGHVEALRIVPASPPACPPALAAIAEADWLIFGPGSWYTSVLPHLLVPELAEAIVTSPARRLVTLNLAADNETLGLSVADHLAALHWYLPRLRVDTVLADAKWVGEPDPVHRAAQALGARLVLAPLAVADGSPKHDPESLGTALVPVLGSDR